MTRILTVGAGATGGYFGARLAQAGRDVTFLVRPRRAATLRERGLRLTGLGEDEVLTPRLVTAGEIAGPYDIVLLSVKAAALEAAMDDLAPAVGTSTLIVPFLNGMAHLDALEKRFGAGVLGGVVKVVTTLGPDGEIVRLAPMAAMTIGETAGGTSSRVEEAGAALDVDGFDVEVSADIIGAMWAKWVLISSITAITCLMRGSVGEIVAVPGGEDFARRVLAETSSVATAAGHPVAERSLAGIAARVTEAGSPLVPSLYRDMSAGLPTEGEHVLADLSDRARTLGVATPLLDLAAMNLRVYDARS